MTKIIIFDVFGVLISRGFKSSCEKLSKILKKEINEIKPIYERWEIPFDIGSFSEKKFWELFQQDLNTNVDWELLNQTVLESYYPLNDSLRLLIEYSQKTNTFILSNTRKEWFEYIDRKYSITKHVKQSFLSYEIGLLKPDLNIYLYVIRKLGVSPDKMIFIDDSIDNIRTALSIGINAHHFIDGKTTEKFLEDNWQ